MDKNIGITIIGETRILFNKNMIKYHNYLQEQFNNLGYNCIFFTIIEKDEGIINYNNPLLNNKEQYIILNSKLKFADLINYIDNDIVKSTYQELLGDPNVEKMMNGCLAQHSKKILAYNLINNYEKKNNTKFIGFFRIRTDFMYSFNINDVINNNKIFMVNDIFSYVPSQYSKEYYLDNSKYISKLKVVPADFYIKNLIKKQIPVCGFGHDELKCNLGPEFRGEFHCLVIRQNRYSSEIGIVIENWYPNVLQKKKKKFLDTLIEKLKFKNYIILPSDEGPGKKFYNLDIKIYRLFNTDLKNYDDSELIKHYNSNGKNEKRIHNIESLNNYFSDKNNIIKFLKKNPEFWEILWKEYKILQMHPILDREEISLKSGTPVFYFGKEVDDCREDEENVLHL